MNAQRSCSLDGGPCDLRAHVRAARWPQAGACKRDNQPMIRPLTVGTIAVVVVLLSATNAAASSTDRSALTRAVDRSWAQDAVRAQGVSTRDRQAEPQVEEFIAPDRVRLHLPPSEVGTTQVPATEIIAVGTLAWIQDSQAPPPADQLFVPCPRLHASAPQAKTWMYLVVEKARIRQVAPRRFRYEMPTEVVKEFAVNKLGGEVTLSRSGLVKTVSIENSASAARWRMSYGDVPPIEPPPAVQIRAGEDCRLSPFGSGIVFTPTSQA